LRLGWLSAFPAVRAFGFWLLAFWLSGFLAFSFQLSAFGFRLFVSEFAREWCLPAA
jgi:hypothetical protein